jgi:7-cyano-7-deazaguanine reductase
VTKIDRSSADLEAASLGQDTAYIDTYTPSLLHPILREDARRNVGLPLNLACQGEDLWTGYEFSWLDMQGIPQVAGLRLRVPCQSQAMVESKSMKLYLNSFAMTKFETHADVLKTLDQDLALAFRSPLIVELLELSQLASPVHQLTGLCLDELDVRISKYEHDVDLLRLEPGDRVIHESLHTHAFRSLCPVTGQPDWASVNIDYVGAPIDRAQLFKYLVSYRNHQAFHETTIEQIFFDLTQACAPQSLSVYGRFQRRGGLDINPYRSSEHSEAPLCRLPRQ